MEDKLCPYFIYCVRYVNQTSDLLVNASEKIKVIVHGSGDRYPALILLIYTQFARFLYMSFI